MEGRERDDSIGIVNTADGREIARLKPPGAELTKLAFIGATHRIVAGSARGELLILDADQEAELGRRRFGTKEIGAVASDPTGANVLVGDDAGRWCLLSGEQLVEKKCLQRKGSATQGALYADGRRALIVETDGYYNTLGYDFGSGVLLRDYGHTVPTVAIDKSGALAFRAEQLVSTSDDMPLMSLEQDRSLEQTAVSENGRRLLVLNVDGELFGEDIRPGKIRLQKPMIEKVNSFSQCSPDAAAIAYVNQNGEVHYRSAVGEDLALFVMYSKHGAGSISCSRDGRYVAVVDDTVVHIWDHSTRRSFVVGPRQPSEVEILAVSPDGREMITGGNHDAYVWPLSGNTQISVLDGSGGAERVSAAAYDPKGRFMVTGSFDGNLRLWRRDPNSAWKLVSQTKAHKYSVSAAAVSESGLVATTDEIEKDVALWSVEGDRLVRNWDKPGIGSSQVFAGQPMTVRRIDLLPRRRDLATRQ